MDGGVGDEDTVLEIHLLETFTIPGQLRKTRIREERTPGKFDSSEKGRSPAKGDSSR